MPPVASFAHCANAGMQIDDGEPPRGSLIAHTIVEGDQVSPRVRELLRGFDRIIVPNEWSRAVLTAHGVVPPVSVVAPVAGTPVPGDRGVPLDLPDDAVVFYTIAGWNEREAPLEVIRAFVGTFTADDPVALVVKTSSIEPRAAALEIAQLVRFSSRPPQLRVEVDEWTRERVAGLHTRGDCYLSLAPSEGWGLSAFDAAAYGNPIVMTEWSGPLGFLDRDTVPRLEPGAAVLREIAADVGEARRRAEPLRDRVLHDFAGPRVVAEFLHAVPEARTPRRPLGDEPLLLVGLMAGPWRPAFDNWVEMAERHGYRYEIVGRDVETYVPHLAKLRLLVDHLSELAPDQLVFYLDASDGFVCDSPARTLARYRSYTTPLVIGAEDLRHELHGFEVPDPAWRWSNSGAFVGAAGIIVDALREGYELVDWEDYGHVCDQHAINVYLSRSEHSHLATVDHRRTIVQNIRTSVPHEELTQHRAMVERGLRSACTSAVHFFGANDRGYDSFAELYGLRRTGGRDWDLSPG